MTPSFACVGRAALVAGLLAVPLTLPAFAQEKKDETITPASRSAEGWWAKRHEERLEQVKQGNIDLVFLGDSITQGWEGNGGKPIWERFYAPRHPLNLGFSGDRTQHVLWRLDNGEVDGIKPKAAVLMIGTNNVGGNSADEIAAGIKAVVLKLREKLPETKILVLGVFPRSEKPDAARERLAQVNEKVQSLADGKSVFFLDIGKAFLQEDGTISKEIMPDFLHLSPKGYRIWADSIEPKLWELTETK